MCPKRATQLAWGTLFVHGLYMPVILYSTQVPYGRHWVMPQHTRTRETHDTAHAFAHHGLVAMHRALLACALVIAKATMVKPETGVCKQLRAFRTKPIATMTGIAIYPYHLSNRALLAFYTTQMHHTLINIALQKSADHFTSRRQTGVCAVPRTACTRAASRCSRPRCSRRVPAL